MMDMCYRVLFFSPKLYLLKNINYPKLFFFLFMFRGSQTEHLVCNVVLNPKII